MQNFKCEVKQLQRKNERKKKSHYYCIVSATRQVPIALVRVLLVKVREKKLFRNAYQTSTFLGRG